MGICIHDTMEKYKLSTNMLEEKDVMNRVTMGHIKKGENVNTKYYNRFFEWLRVNKPEAYKECMNHIIENMKGFKMD